MISLPLKGGGNSRLDESHETYIPDVAWALQERDAKGSESDSDTKDGHLIIQPVTHALRAEGADAGEDGTGRRTPLIVAATLNSGGNSGGFRSEPGEHLVACPIAFSSKDHGADAGEISPTLRSMEFKDSHMNGGGQVAIAFESRVARNGRGAPSDIVPPLKAESGQTGKGDSAPLTAGNFGVRRLTPREAERLQGFEDDWTLYDADGKVISDSARYRMLGNAVAVPVARWIGQRIVAVETGQ